MPDRDKPTVHFSHAQLSAEVTKPDPFIYATASGKRVTFPDIFDMDADDGEKFLGELRDAQATLDTGTLLRKWLSPADMAKLAEEKFSLRERMLLVRHVESYYESAWADLGEGVGSAN